MKKSIKLVLTSLAALSSVVTISGCGNNSNSSSFKVGLITLHDENSTYDKNFIDAMKEACQAENVELVLKTGVNEDNGCYNTAAELADGGCNIVFADSFGHEQYMMKAAKEYTNVQFAHATGTYAKQSNIANFHNAFASIYEGRYLAGVVAGLKLQEMAAANPNLAKNENGNYVLGYVGAYAYAEVISGYTSWFLGVKSVVSNVEMNVNFTGSWYDEAAEREAANTLISNGAVIISQHADSMGAPSACKQANVPIPNVSYNGSTESSCSGSFLVSSRINWTPYFKMMIQAVKKGENFATDYCGSIQDGMVELTALGAAAAAGTQAKVDEVKAKLVSGELKVFDNRNFTVKGETLSSYLADVITDDKFTPDTEAMKTANGVTYFAESELRSGPYFNVNIDGITCNMENAFGKN